MTTTNCEHTCTLDQSIQMEEQRKIPSLSGVLNWLTEKMTAMKNRHSLEKLTYASDHELADMGLARDDLYIIRKSGFFKDPSVELQFRVKERTRRI